MANYNLNKTIKIASLYSTHIESGILESGNVIIRIYGLEGCKDGLLCGISGRGLTAEEAATDFVKELGKYDFIKVSGIKYPNSFGK